jgi:hypothetical protein
MMADDAIARAIKARTDGSAMLHEPPPVHWSTGAVQRQSLSRVAQAVLYVGKDYFGESSDIEGYIDKYMPKNYSEARDSIVNNLVTMANDLKTKWEFKDWMAAIHAVANALLKNKKQLPEPTRSFKNPIGEENPNYEETTSEKGEKGTDWQQKFWNIVKQKQSAYHATLKDDFVAAEKGTGANDAHQSLAQAASHSATALAMEEAITVLANQGCPEKQLKKFRKTKENTVKKAKQTGETHHM